MARKPKSSDAGEGANWMDTYGDLVTLLLCFFVLLFASSSTDAAKWEALVGAFSGTTVTAISQMNPDSVMQDAIETMPRTSETPEEVDSAAAAEGNTMELYENVKAYINENDVNAEIEADMEGYKVTMRFADNVLFDSGKADLRPEAYELLDHFISAVSPSMKLIEVIEVEGHTDDVPISGGEFRNNWVLSAARSVTVVEYLLTSDEIDVYKVKPTSFGEYHPIDESNTDEARAKNRRVDFIIVAYRHNVS